MERIGRTRETVALGREPKLRPLLVLGGGEGGGGGRKAKSGKAGKREMRSGGAGWGCVGSVVGARASEAEDSAMECSNQYCNYVYNCWGYEASGKQKDSRCDDQDELLPIRRQESSRQIAPEQIYRQHQAQ